MLRIGLFMALLDLVPACGGDESKPPGGGGANEGEGEGTLGDPCPELGACPEGFDCCDTTRRCVQSEQAQGEECRSTCTSDADCGGTPCQEGECVKGTPPGDEGEGEGIPAECPQIFAGTWWAEFPEVHRTDGQEYDFMAPGLDAQFWREQEVTFEQVGCMIRGPDRQFLWDDGGSGKITPPRTFFYELMWIDLDGGQNHPLRSTGQISANKQSINGTCDGEYRNWGDSTLFPITCTFTLTRR